MSVEGTDYMSIDCCLDEGIQSGQNTRCSRI